MLDFFFFLVFLSLARSLPPTARCHPHHLPLRARFSLPLPLPLLIISVLTLHSLTSSSIALILTLLSSPSSVLPAKRTWLFKA